MKKLITLLTAFDKISEELSFEYTLDKVDLSDILEILGKQHNDPLYYDVYLLTKNQLEKIIQKHHLLIEKDIDKYDFFLERCEV